MWDGPSAVTLFPPPQGGISNIMEELVVQPLLVSISALTLATETVRSILKIDDVVGPAGPLQALQGLVPGTSRSRLHLLYWQVNAR